MTGAPFLRKFSLALLGFSLSLAAYGEEFVVKIKKNFDLENFTNQVNESAEFIVLEQNETSHLVLVKTSSDMSLAQIKEQLKNLPPIEYIVPNIKFHISVPNDPMLNQQWALQKVGAEKAWGLSTSKTRPIVAVIDTGVDYNHEDLKDQMLRSADGKIEGWNFFDNNADAMDITKAGANPGHGTHCAGIIAAAHNAIGISGIAPQVAIMPLRFIGPDGSGDLMNAIKAIDFAIEHKAQIISASWGAAVSRQNVTPLIEAIDRANQKGVIFVAAAANDGKSNDTREVFPANAGLANVISVAASDKNDAKPQWSNFGRATVDIASPGAGILSTLPGNKYGELSGTSMATPYVAGLMALLLAQADAEGRKYTAPEWKALIQANSQQVDIETACHCRISADLAMQAVLDNKLTVVPNAATFKAGDTIEFHAIGGKGPYKFSSSNEKSSTISEDGKLKAVADGKTTIKVVDADGKEALSQDVYVGRPEAPPGGGGGGGGSGDCPLGNPELCAIICKIMPDAPWCKKLADEPGKLLGLNTI